MKKIIALLTVVLTIVSCDRETDTLGPNLSDLFGPFQVLEEFKSLTNNVDFSNGQSVAFECRFSKQVNWEIHIVGQSSGAEKVITGFTNSIDASNGGVWDGTTTNLPMFNSEDCLAYLTVNAVDTMFSDTLSNLISVGSTRVVDGFAVTDFEGGLNPGFNVFVQSGANMRLDTVNNPTGAQGNTFYQMSGEVTFIEDLGNIEMPKTAFTDTGFILSNNGGIVYFNFFARKAAGIANEILVFQFMEDENDDGVFDANSEDLYEYVLVGLPTEWEQFSIKYEDFELRTSGGNGRKEPHKLNKMFLLPVSGQRTPFEAYVDYLIFTENEPLKP